MSVGDRKDGLESIAEREDRDERTLRPRPYRVDHWCPPFRRVLLAPKHDVVDVTLAQGGDRPIVGESGHLIEHHVVRAWCVAAVAVEHALAMLDAFVHIQPVDRIATPM